MADEPIIGRRLQLTPMEFRSLLTPFEEAGIRAFAKGKGVQAGVVAVWVSRLESPALQTVDLSKAENVNGLYYLVSLGLLSPMRADIIAQGVPADPAPTIIQGA